MMRRALETAKTRPILFSGPMVLAILAGSKTQTRRIVKPQPAPDREAILSRFPKQDGCPYGKLGDRLWVRETLGVTAQGDCAYMADNLEIEDPRTLDLCERYGDSYHFSEVKGIPSIFMPRWACRLVLEVKAARVERLQAISEADAEAEGVDRIKAKVPLHRDAYRYLWDDINGLGAWEKNPWVWVVEFKRTAESAMAIAA